MKNRAMGYESYRNHTSLRFWLTARVLAATMPSSVGFGDTLPSDPARSPAGQNWRAQMARVYGIGWEPGAPYEAYDVHLVRGQKSAPMLASVFLEYDIGWVGAPPPVPSLRAD